MFLISINFVMGTIIFIVVFVVNGRRRQNFLIQKDFLRLFFCKYMRESPPVPRCKNVFCNLLYKLTKCGRIFPVHILHFNPILQFQLLMASWQPIASWQCYNCFINILERLIQRVRRFCRYYIFLQTKFYHY